MKREIKFRFWDTVSQKMLYNELAPLYYHVPRSVYGEEIEGEAHLYSLSQLLSNPEFIAQQFTGLKDSDGEDIYEGDTLIWYSVNGKAYEAKVVFSPTVAAFVLDVSGRHLIDGKYGDFQHLYEGHSYKIKK
jgi:hypothetical protein